MSGLRLASLLALLGACSAFTLSRSGLPQRVTRTGGVVRMGWFDKEPVDPRDKLNPSGSYGNPGKAKRAAPPTQSRNRFGGKSAGNAGRSDFMDISNQDDASYLPDSAKNFLFNREKGNSDLSISPDVEGLIALQGVFFGVVLLPAILIAVYFASQ